MVDSRTRFAHRPELCQKKLVLVGMQKVKKLTRIPQLAHRETPQSGHGGAAGPAHVGRGRLRAGGAAVPCTRPPRRRPPQPRALPAAATPPLAATGSCNIIMHNYVDMCDPKRYRARGACGPPGQGRRQSRPGGGARESRRPGVQLAGWDLTVAPSAPLGLG
jgi:hypothetical protein